mmetsp:Transcript_26246/g.55718  ORF Transcript_26246/g.55718 Transcript_26246/m.55718 type:complete len:341 (+) Transcript_26246:894-1916(+)
MLLPLLLLGDHGLGLRLHYGDVPAQSLMLRTLLGTHGGGRRRYLGGHRHGIGCHLRVGLRALVFLEAHNGTATVLPTAMADGLDSALEAHRLGRLRWRRKCRRGPVVRGLWSACGHLEALTMVKLRCEDEARLAINAEQATHLEVDGDLLAGGHDLAQLLNDATETHEDVVLREALRETDCRLAEVEVLLVSQVLVRECRLSPGVQAIGPSKGLSDLKVWSHLGSAVSSSFLNLPTDLAEVRYMQGLPLLYGRRHIAVEGVPSLAVALTPSQERSAPLGDVLQQPVERVHRKTALLPCQLPSCWPTPLKHGGAAAAVAAACPEAPCKLGGGAVSRGGRPS